LRRPVHRQTIAVHLSIEGATLNRSTAIRVYAALLTAMTIWGFSFLVIKDALDTVPVFSLLFARFLVAAVLLGLLAVFRRALVVARKELLALVGLSVLSPVGYFLFETFGVARTQPSHVAVIIATIPIAVYLIAFARRQERASWKKTVGILTAYAGILLIIGFGQRETGASRVGDLLVLGAVLCAAARTSLIKDVLRRVTPLQLTFYQFTFSLLVFGPLAATDGLGWLSRVSTFALLEILFLGVFCSAGAFLAMHYALSHLSATQVAVSANVVPLITLIAEVTLLGSPLSPVKGVGTAITVAGVLLTQWDRTSRTPPGLDMEGSIIKR
jgi:drug/metabolite transporter (DMT)-like permease